MFCKFYCSESKSGAKVTPAFELEVLPYKLINSDSILKEHPDFNFTNNGKLLDLIPFEKHFGNFLISEKFKSILIELNVTGWECFPVKINGVSDKYYCFQVLGRIGPIINLEKVNLSFGKERRMIELSTWDGSDIFSADKTLNIFCHKSLAEKLSRLSISNLSIEESNDKFQFV